VASSPAVRRLGSKAQYVGSLAEKETEHECYHRINNTGSHSYVKRPPCYARRRRRCRTLAVTEKEKERGNVMDATYPQLVYSSIVILVACDADQDTRLLDSLFR
jgi:hypothetical protein